MQTAITVAKMIEEISRFLPEDSRSKMVLARFLLMCLQIRLIPDYLLIPSKAMEYVKSVKWPGLKHRVKITVIAQCFNGLSDEGAAEFKIYLNRLLEENSPKDSLKAHFTAEFGVTCHHTDHIARARDENQMLARFIMALTESVGALEDFTVPLTPSVRNKKIKTIIFQFYLARGYEVTLRDCYVIARKPDQTIKIDFSNFSDAADSCILVTSHEM